MRRSESMRLPCRLAAVFLLVASARGYALPEELFVVGSAYDPDSGELLYREHHYCTDERRQCTIEYRDPAGEKIARKELDYGDSPYRPDVRMVDHRRDRETAIDPPSREDLVVDAGFDNYVRSRWDALAGGETVSFAFQPVGFDDPLQMKAQRLGNDTCAAGELCLEVDVASWLLGLFGEPIRLAYDRDSRRLLRFQGVSNLRDAQGDSQLVDIRYEYDPEREAGAGATD